MKNIHILPTDKPSRLYSFYGLLEDLSYGKTFTFANKEIAKINLYKNLKDYQKKLIEANWKSENIYITSDEEIKEGDYYLTKTNDVLQAQKPERAYEPTGKKIILTTDQDLISKTCVHNFVNVLNDAFKCTKCKKEVLRSEITISDTIHSVQAIDDEFLEWFVKNPSCKEVEIKQHFIDFKTIGKYVKEYIIIIPKEEPNIVVRDSIDYGNHYHKLLDIQHEGKELSIKEVMEGRSSAYDFIDFDKQETLEEKKPYWELLDKKAEVNNTIDLDAYAIGVEDGIKWQAERRMYSEEDMKKAFIAGFTPKITTTLNDSFNKWFEQFKKK